MAFPSFSATQVSKLALFAALLMPVQSMAERAGERGPCPEYKVRIGELLIRVPNEWGTYMKKNGRHIKPGFCHAYDGKVIEASWVGFSQRFSSYTREEKEGDNYVYAQFGISSLGEPKETLYDRALREIGDKGLTLKKLPVEDGFYRYKSYAISKSLFAAPDTPLTIHGVGRQEPLIEPGHPPTIIHRGTGNQSVGFIYKNRYWGGASGIQGEHVRLKDWPDFYPDYRRPSNMQ